MTANVDDGYRARPAIAGGLALLAVAVAVVAYGGALTHTYQRWMIQDEYSHGFLIPPISLWLLWTRRDAILGSLGPPSWIGLILIVGAGAVHVVGELTALFLLSQVAFVVTLFGVALLAGGFSLFRVTFIPIFFLFFAIPLPYFVDAMLSWRLQLISSELGVFFIRLFQVPVFLEGNVIDLGQYKLQVVEACSGLRYLYPFLSLGFLAAYLFQAPLWQRGLVFLSTVPITIVMNSFRIGLVGLLVDRFGRQSADGWLHFFEGWIIFIACAVLLVLEIDLLARLTSKRSFLQAFSPPVVTPIRPAAGAPSMRHAALAASIAVLIGSGIAAQVVTGRQEYLPERTSFTRFPTRLGDWRGEISALEPQLEHSLGLTDYILADYARADRRSVNLYVAYYASQRKGLSPHSPSVCIPSNGWQIAKFERSSYKEDGVVQPFPLNRVIIQKNANQQLVYYWFEQRGRKIENEWWSKWHLLVDAVIKNRTDGALVRLTTQIYPGETEEDADRRLMTFIRESVPVLSAHLPAEAPHFVAPNQSRPAAKVSRRAE